MKEERYSISEASRLLELENHVLRYWEEELDLKIPRNEQGHRYYQEKEIRILSCIKELKNKGFQLKAVKEILPDLEDDQKIDVHKLLEAQVELESTQADPPIIEPASNPADKEDKLLHFPAHKENNLPESPVRSREEKMLEFENIMERIIGRALREQAREMGALMGDQISSRVLEGLNVTLEEYSEKTEDYFKKLDETIRTHQRARQEAAVAREDGGKRKSLFFKKNKRRV